MLKIHRKNRGLWRKLHNLAGGRAGATGRCVKKKLRRVQKRLTPCAHASRTRLHGT